jgi:hypothetical protein
VVVRQRFFQQGDGRLAVIFCGGRGAGLTEPGQYQQTEPGEFLHKPHDASLVLVGVSRA